MNLTLLGNANKNYYSNYHLGSQIKYYPWSSSHRNFKKTSPKVLWELTSFACSICLSWLLSCVFCTVVFWPKPQVLTVDRPLLPVNLDWVPGLMLDTGRTGLVTWPVGTEFVTEMEPEVMVVMGIELVTILWTWGFDSVVGRASATVCKERRERKTWFKMWVTYPLKNVEMFRNWPLVHSGVLPGTAAAEAATGDEELAASAAVAGPGSVSVGLQWQALMHLLAPLPGPGVGHQAELSLLTVPAVKVPVVGPLSGGHLGTSCLATGEEGCVDLQHSVLEVL